MVGSGFVQWCKRFVMGPGRPRSGEGHAVDAGTFRIKTEVDVLNRIRELTEQNGTVEELGRDPGIAARVTLEDGEEVVLRSDWKIAQQHAAITMPDEEAVEHELRGMFPWEVDVAVRRVGQGWAASARWPSGATQFFGGATDTELLQEARYARGIA